MKLSQLVYLCIKNVVYYDDFSFTYEEFLKGTFKDTPDYSVNINNVYTPLNEAIARLSDLERIPYRVEACDINNRIIELSKCSKKVKEVISIAQSSYKGFEKLEHKPFGLGRVFVSDYSTYGDTYIEYKEDIPTFSELNMPYYLYGSLVEIDDYELRDLGITDSMCNYIVEYVTGRLYEPINADISNMHITRAEQYFANIKPTSSAFAQKAVEASYRVGE